MVYEIITYDLIDKKIRLVKERPDLKTVSGQHGERDRIVNSEGEDAICGPRSKLSTNLGTAKDRLSADEFPMFLPYFADVTEDLPSVSRKLNIIPDTYKHCQLMTETHGGYLQFFDHKTEKTLRIALNSNTYSPLKNKA